MIAHATGPIDAMAEFECRSHLYPGHVVEWRLGVMTLPN